MSKWMEWYKNDINLPGHREEYNRQAREWRSTLKGKFQQLKQDRKDKEITLSFEEYVTLIKQGCHYCHKSLEGCQGSSIDRIDNSKGYLKSNVLPCCKSCNLIRGEQLTVQETEIVIKALLKYRRQK